MISIDPKFDPNACPFCGKNPCISKVLLVKDNSCDDATDGAHPAWWRGEKSGSEGTARALARVAREGHVGTFGSAVVEEAAQEIMRLRKALELRDEEIRLCRKIAEARREQIAILRGRG